MYHISNQYVVFIAHYRKISSQNYRYSTCTKPLRYRWEGKEAGERKDRNNSGQSKCLRGLRERHSNCERSGVWERTKGTQVYVTAKRRCAEQ